MKSDQFNIETFVDFLVSEYCTATFCCYDSCSHYDVNAGKRNLINDLRYTFTSLTQDDFDKKVKMHLKKKTLDYVYFKNKHNLNKYGL